jgi:DHA1 family tetracycline resistance protein-like MFS transporter
MTSSATFARPQSPNLNFVLICVFIDMLGIGLIIPVLPSLVGEFVHGRDQQSLWYGVMTSVFGLMQFLCMPVVGAVSDQVGRRPVLLYSMGGMCINFLATAWAPNLAWLFLGRVIGGASSASMSVASAYASDVTSPDERAKSFGKIGAAFGLGFICGPMLGGLLGNMGLHLPFYVAAGLSAANFIYGWLVVPESLPPERRTRFSLARVNPFDALVRLARRTDIRGLIIVYALLTFAQMMLQSTWVLYTTFRFNWTPRDNGIALFCVGLCSIVVQAGLLAWLIRRLGQVRLALLGLASGTVTYVLYGLATQGWMMYVFILCNLLAFAAGPALQAIVSNASADRDQGELMGSLQSVASIGLIVMPLAGTATLSAASHMAPGDWRFGGIFFACAFIEAAALVVAWRYFRTHDVGAAPTPAAHPLPAGKI